MQNPNSPFSENIGGDGEIQAWGRKCLAAFNRNKLRLEKAGDHPHLSLTDYEIEHARFKIWAGNLGVLHSGVSSLDARLRDSRVIRSSMLRLLSRLVENTEQIFEVITGRRPPLEQQLVRPDVDDDSVNSSDEEEIIEVVQRFGAVKSIMADLYKLSFKIRNSSSRTVSSRALTYKELDKDSGIDMFNAILEFDQRHVYEYLAASRREVAGVQSRDKSSVVEGTWPDLSARDLPTLKHGTMNKYSTDDNDFLPSRVAKANTQRRKYFAYWRKHALKLSQESDLAETSQPIQETVLAPFNDEAENEANPALLRAPNLLAPGPKTILSGTDATKFNRQIEESLETETVISYATTAHGSDGKAISIPPPPPDAISMPEFICPLCHVACPSRQGQGKAWRSHVLRDMQPYVCTYRDCPVPEKLYTNRTAWLEHERLTHRRIWQCHEHPSFVYTTKDSFLTHLSDLHDNLTADQAQQLADFAEASKADERESCPFCEKAGSFDGGLQNHMAYHQERLASFSLPRNMNSTDNDNSNSSQAQGIRSLDSLDTASKESWSDEEKESPIRVLSQPYLVKAAKAHVRRQENDLEFEKDQIMLVYAEQGPIRHTFSRYLYGYYLPFEEIGDDQPPKIIKGKFLGRCVEGYKGIWSLRQVHKKVPFDP